MAGQATPPYKGLNEAGYNAGFHNDRPVGLAGLRPALGLLFGSGLELIRVSFPKNPRKQ